VTLTELERRRAEGRVVFGSASDAPEPRIEAAGERALQKDEQREALYAAMEALPARQRQCLLLRVRDELSYDEIASLLRLNLLTVRNHIAEAKKTLRRQLQDARGRETT
jgi:RNA polymerase sigma factor (sigma-70 family)